MWRISNIHTRTRTSRLCAHAHKQPQCCFVYGVARKLSSANQNAKTDNDIVKNCKNNTPTNAITCNDNEISISLTVASRTQPTTHTHTSKQKRQKNKLCIPAQFDVCTQIYLKLSKVKLNKMMTIYAWLKYECKNGNQIAWKIAVHTVAPAAAASSFVCREIACNVCEFNDIVLAFAYKNLIFISFIHGMCLCVCVHIAHYIWHT